MIGGLLKINQRVVLWPDPDSEHDFMYLDSSSQSWIGFIFKRKSGAKLDGTAPFTCEACKKGHWSGFALTDVAPAEKVTLCVWCGKVLPKGETLGTIAQ